MNSDRGLLETWGNWGRLMPLDWGVLVGTLGALAGTAASAAHPATWPMMVGGTVLAGMGLVVLWAREVLSTGQVLVGAVVLRLIYFPLLPGLSDDAFRYIWDGWIQWHGINPYRFVPSSEALAPFQTAPIYEKLNSPDYYSVYPPLSQIAFAIGGLVHNFGWQASYYVTKGVLLGAELGAVVLLSRMVAAHSLLLYAWNPLVLLETAGQGHTEALLMLCLVGLVWAVRVGRGWVASLAVAGAGLVKLYPFLLGPLLLRRFGWQAVWPGAVLTGAAFLPYAASYTVPHILASVELFARLFEFNAGPYYAVKAGLRWITGTDWSKVIGPAFRGTSLVLISLVYVIDWRRSMRFARSALWILGLFYVFSSTVHPWYLLPLLGLSVLVRSPVWPWFWLGVCSTGTYLFYLGGAYWSWVWAGWGGALLSTLHLYGGHHWRRVRNALDKLSRFLHGSGGREHRP
jgi:hypothetical protein